MPNNISNEAVKELLFYIADNDLIIGHRNSEWTGLGPVLEEDIAFSSMAQDKLGHAQAVYTILHEEFGEQNPDIIAFTRNAKDFLCCQFAELPIGDYDFSLMRHFLFDHADFLRFQMLSLSSFEPIAKVARKFRGEIKYHLIHADTWIVQLGKGNEESHTRLQTALNESFPLALGMFEPSKFEDELIASGVFVGEKALQEAWLEIITPILFEANLVLPEIAGIEPIFGGREGIHTEYLQPLLDEMTEVFRIDTEAEW